MRHDPSLGTRETDHAPGEAAVIPSGEAVDGDAAAVGVHHAAVAHVDAGVEHAASGCVGEADHVARPHLGEVPRDHLAAGVVGDVVSQVWQADADLGVGVQNEARAVEPGDDASVLAAG